MKSVFKFLWLLVFLSSNLFSQEEKKLQVSDSIQSLHKSLFDPEKSIEERIQLAKIAIELSEKHNDSLLLVSGRFLAYQYLLSNQDENFLETTNKFLKLADRFNSKL